MIAPVALLAAALLAAPPGTPGPEPASKAPARDPDAAVIENLELLERLELLQHLDVLSGTPPKASVEPPPPKAPESTPAEEPATRPPAKPKS